MANSGQTAAHTPADVTLHPGRARGRRAGACGLAAEQGLLALRNDPLLEPALRALAERPGVLLVNATGRDRAGWRTDLDTAIAVVLASTRRARTPEPLRRARELTRYARRRRNTTRATDRAAARSITTCLTPPARGSRLDRLWRPAGF